VQAQIRTLDGEPAPVGEVGEIWVRGKNIMAGYWNRPQETAAALTEDGWYRSGDMAHADDGGYIFIVDRAKDMIISGGENIYSVQVEEAVNQHPSVLECAVIGVPDDEWGESVKAFVVLKPDTTATEQEIIDTARQHLASYQKPRTVEFVAELPKAPTGKILKRSLRDPYWADQERSV